MRIKELFTVPEGEKITEKLFSRVLLSSICSILLCMACLVSTTWAWFTVSIENTGNEIWIASVTPDVKITSGQELITPVDGSYTLDAGTYRIDIGLEQLEKTSDGANLLNDPKCPVYVIMAISHEGGVECQSFQFTSKEDVKTHQLTVGNGAAGLSFSVSWVMPAGAAPVDDMIVIGEVSEEIITELSSNEETTESAAAPTETTAVVG